MLGVACWWWKAACRGPWGAVPPDCRAFFSGVRVDLRDVEIGLLARLSTALHALHEAVLLCVQHAEGDLEQDLREARALVSEAVLRLGGS